MISYDPIPGGFNVIYENGVKLGELLVEIDGFYVFYPIQNGGCWHSHVLRAIADKIDELDKPYYDMMAANLMAAHEKELDKSHAPCDTGDR